MAAFTAIDDPGLHYKTKIYAGTGSTATITGVGFQPDFTWIKNRDDTYWHNLVDSVRGYNKYIFSNVTNVEGTHTDRLTSWNSDGFVLSTDGNVNASGDDLVSWNWKGGTTTGITTDGSTTITPSAYSFNQDAGFSIVKYTGNQTSGAKVAHGLGATPDLIILKDTSKTAGWPVYHQSMGETKYVMLQSTQAETTSTGYWNDTAPDSVNFTLGNNTDTNDSDNIFIGYCWVEKQGFSKVGIYKGNGNADGTFVYTGFRPAYILLHANISAGYNWPIYDNKREGRNSKTGSTGNNWLVSDSDSAEDDNNYVDLLSNGFKFISTNGHVNAATDYIYMAFAEAPLVNSNGVPSNAR